MHFVDLRIAIGLEAWYQMDIAGYSEEMFDRKKWLHVVLTLEILEALNEKST